MDQIFINLTDPSWWFTGIFFLIIGILLANLFSKWLPKLFKVFSIFLPIASKKIFRMIKKKNLVRVKKYRQHEIRINWLIARYWSIATLTTIYMVFSLVIYLLYPNLHNTENQKYLIISLFISVYALIFITIREKKLLDSVINAHIYWVKIQK